MSRLHELLRASTDSFPNRTAVEDPERDRSVTYKELDTASNALRKVFERHGVERGDRVGIYLPKSIDSVVSIFGALKSGAAYVPVDPLAPASRNAYIFANCSVRAIIVDDALADSLIDELDLSVRTEEIPAGIFGSAARLLVPKYARRPEQVDDLAYILYTSGSTGKPKGVMHTHESALSFVDWCSETFEPTAEDRFSSHAPFHFDLSILDLYVPLKHGGSIVLIGEDLGKLPLRLAEVIAEQGISMWYSTPSILRLLLEYGKMEEHDYSALRVVNFAGEVFPVKHLRALLAAWPNCRYFNLYGPTETNVCTFYEVVDEIPEERTEPLPIGKTCSNDRSLVFDGGPVEPGKEGELLITGGSVMKGYWNMPERTAESFYIDEMGTFWYHTGDIVQKDKSGDYIFLGRRDRMVKRRGYRIELGEIEAAFYRHPSVREAAVIAKTDDDGGVLIKAYLSWQDEKPPSLIRLKRFASENLPLYMIPDEFSFHPVLPKTSTDKVDYQGLAQLV